MTADAQGCGLRWHGTYWSSLVFDPSSDGSRQDLYFGPVGADPHHHSWLKWTNGELAEIGARLKDPNLQERPPSYHTTQFSTETLARFRASWNPERNCVTTEIADVFSGSAHTSTPSQSARTQSTRDIPMIDVAVPPEARTIQGELAYCYIPDGSTATALSTEVAYLRLSSDDTVGVAITITDWSSE